MASLPSQIAEVCALGYNSDVHNHLRRLERIWIDFPIYFVTTCTHDRKPVLARYDAAEVLIDEWRAAHDRHGWAVGRYVVMPDHVHFFAGLNWMRSHYPTLSGFGRATQAGGSMRSNSRGQRPRLQRCGNANSLITSCVQAKVIPKSGTTSGTILSALAWSPMQANGITQAKSRR